MIHDNEYNVGAGISGYQGKDGYVLWYSGNHQKDYNAS